MALELATPADLVDYQAKDPELLLTAAQEVVRTYCGWHISPSRVDTLTTTLPFTSSLFLPTLNLTSVTSVTENGTLLDPTYYEVNPAGYLTRVGLPTLLTWGTVTSTVTVFTHGYATVPADIQAVVLALADRMTGNPGVLSQVGQVIYTTASDSFTDAERSVLRAYRIPALP